MQTRRYDIDAMRVIAIGLLLIYHTAICFQPWGAMIGFLVAPRGWPEIWPAMTMLNVWRIPLLFFVSGMGLQMAMRRRTLKQIWLDRCKRIGIPLLFGSLVVVPLQTMIILNYYQVPIAYMPGMAHLWFLGNILVYALVLAPLSYLLPEAVRAYFQKSSSRVFGGMALLVLIMLALLAEAIVLDARPFELYAFTLHGWVLGFIAFTGGYLMMAADEKLWLILRKSKWLLLALAFCLFVKRVYPSLIVADAVMLSLESTLWIFGVFGIANTYLNKPSLFLAKWKEAAYPVYILHMFFLHLGSVLLFPLQLLAPLSFGILLLFVLICSVLFYRYGTRRYKWTSWMFGK
ncbi:MAG: acyltransferase [Sphingobacteriales bacterium]|nr:MAG: acyltransferase [Sphingobacteriales bacterium]